MNAAQPRNGMLVVDGTWIELHNGATLITSSVGSPLASCKKCFHLLVSLPILLLSKFPMACTNCVGLLFKLPTNYISIPMKCSDLVSYFM